MNWYLKVLKQYFVFSGRARRKEFWMFVLFNLIFTIIAAVLDNVLGIAFPMIGYGPIYMVYALAMLIPSLAVSARRLQDIDKSGWLIFIGLIPLIGGIWLIILFCKQGTEGENQFGADPKAVA